MKSCLILVVALLFGALTAAAWITVWDEDFSEVSSWSIIHDPGGGSSISSDGDWGYFYVNAAASEAAFITSDRIPFNPGESALYNLYLQVEGVTASTSYDIAMDQFDASYGWLGTIWNFFPTNSTSIFVGETNINMGMFSYNPNTAFLAPKIGVHTGVGVQTVLFDYMAVEMIPEPRTILLVGLFGATLWIWRLWCSLKK